MWIRTDEHEEAIGALEAFCRFVARVREDPFEWRWAILSLHTALQGFMVVAIRDSAGMFPLANDVAAAWLAAYRSARTRVCARGLVVVRRHARASSVYVPQPAMRARVAARGLGSAVASPGACCVQKWPTVCIFIVGAVLLIMLPPRSAPSEVAE